MSVRKDGLTLEQWKAAEIFATGIKISDKAVGKECKVKASTIRKWKKSTRFKLAILKKFEENMSILRSSRISNLTKFLKPIYRELVGKLEEIDQEDYSIKELLKMVNQIHAEMRQDSMQFTKDKRLLAMLAEYTGRDPDALDEEDTESIDEAEQRYLEKRVKAKKESSGKVIELQKRETV